MSRSSTRALRALVIPPLLGACRFAPPSLLRAMRAPLAAVLGATSLRPRLEASMRAALGTGGYERRHVRDYFRHLADLAASALAVYRSGVRASGIDERWCYDAESYRRCEAALAGGKGMILVCPHLIGLELLAGAATAHFPIAVIARHSPDAVYEAIKQRWYRNLGVHVIHAPHRDSATQGVGEMAGILRALRQNQILAITPDLVQKPGTGVTVRLFGREVELPPGPFFLSVRTGAPLLPFFSRREGDGYRAWTTEPLAPGPGRSRQEAIAEVAQQWTDLFERFLRAHPDMWQFWIDKRWSRWLAAGG